MFTEEGLGETSEEAVSDELEIHMSDETSGKEAPAEALRSRWADFTDTETEVLFPTVDATKVPVGTSSDEASLAAVADLEPLEDCQDELEALDEQQMQQEVFMGITLGAIIAYPHIHQHLFRLLPDWLGWCLAWLVGCLEFRASVSLPMYHHTKWNLCLCVCSCDRRYSTWRSVCVCLLEKQTCPFSTSASTRQDEDKT